MSTMNDVDKLTSFLRRAFLNQGISMIRSIDQKEKHSRTAEEDQRSGTTLVCVPPAISCGLGR